jgi:predicted Zn-dependent protease
MRRIDFGRARHPDRRQVLRRLGVCCGSLSGLGLLGACQSTSVDARMPDQRPQASTDEAGLWLRMDRAEREIAVSPHRIRDAALDDYVKGIICRVAGDHCADMRVYVMRRPFFNASMAPNGMMLVWSGALLRLENEAQLAAVAAHEAGHFIERHSLENYRRLKNNADAAMFFGMIVPVFPVLMAVADLMSFSRSQELHADTIGLQRMAEAGYAPGEAVRVWENELAERDADPKKEDREPFLRTHPAIEERLAGISDTAKFLTKPGQTLRAEEYRTRIRPIREGLLEDEVQLRKPERTLVLLDRLSKAEPQSADLRHYRGEVLRLRGASGDADLARTAYNGAIAIDPDYARTWRGLGMLERSAGNDTAARAAFTKYLELNPEASDGAFLQAYLAQTS